MRWNLAVLRRAVQDLHGPQQRDLVRPCTRSITAPMDYAKYHYYESVDLMAEEIKEDVDEDGVFMLILGVDEEKSSRFREARFKAEAHLIASLQSLHGVPDTLAHVVYFALGLNLQPKTSIHARSISIDRVIGKLCLTADTADLMAILSRMVGTPDHVYLSALVNHCKHRGVIQAAYALSLDSPEKPIHGLRFEHFTYDEVTHPQRWVRDVLPPQVERLSRHFVDAGRELNRVVLKRIESRNAGD